MYDIYIDIILIVPWFFLSGLNVVLEFPIIDTLTGIIPFITLFVHHSKQLRVLYIKKVRSYQCKTIFRVGHSANFNPYFVR